MSKVAIVTDSSVSLPQELIEQNKITVLPLVLIWGDETFRDGVDIRPAEFYSRLENTKIMPSTSQTTPADFQNIYQNLLDQGFDILSVHISSKLSGTIQSAQKAREMLHTDRIEVVDSFSTATAMGFQVIEAARAAAQGAGLPECRDIVEKTRLKTGVLFVVETLKYLHLGGRIGGGARFLGTALDLKPLLELCDGRVEAIDRVRTKRKAIDRMLELVEQRIGDQTPIHLAILHAKAENDARMLTERANDRFHPVESYLSEVSPVVGTHAGPGTVGIAFMAGV